MHPVVKIAGRRVAQTCMICAVIAVDTEPRNAEPRNAEPRNAEPHNAEPRNAERRPVSGAVLYVVRS